MMSDGSKYDETDQHATAAEGHTSHPKHRLEGVAVDAAPPSSDDVFADFGQNPDTELAG